MLKIENNGNNGPNGSFVNTSKKKKMLEKPNSEGEKERWRAKEQYKKNSAATALNVLSHQL